MVGPSGSGKSEYIKNFTMFKTDYKILSADTIRFEMLDYPKTKKDYDPIIEPIVWETFYSKLDLILKSGQNVVIDNTNVEFNRRSEITIRAYRYQYKIKMIVFDLPIQTILDRNSFRDRHVPVTVVLQQYINMKNQYPKLFEYDSMEVIKK